MGTSSALGSDEYEIEQILDRRRSTTDPSTYDYLICWRHYSSQYNSWENERSMEAPALIDAYDAAHPRTPTGSPLSGVSNATRDSGKTEDSPTVDARKAASMSPGMIPLSLRPSPANTPPSDTEPPMEVPDAWIERIIDIRKLPSGRVRYLIQFTNDMDGECEWRDESNFGAYLRMLFFRGQYDQQNHFNPVTIKDPVAAQEEKEEKEKEERKTTQQ
ncbi:hypothetical protein SLS54_010537 [Diplodia seriata]